MPAKHMYANELPMYAFCILVVCSYEFKRLNVFVHMSFSSVYMPVRPSVCPTIHAKSENVCPSICSVNCFYASMYV